jgi:hypothetical protein
MIQYTWTGVLENIVHIMYRTTKVRIHIEYQNHRYYCTQINNCHGYMSPYSSPLRHYSLGRIDFYACSLVEEALSSHTLERLDRVIDTTVDDNINTGGGAGLHVATTRYEIRRTS